MTKRKHIWSAMTLLLIVCCCVTVFFTSLAEETIPYANGEVNPMVRVHLSRLNLTDRLDIILTTPYGLSFGDGNELYVESGSELAFILRNGSIYLYIR